jgi:uncharacterized protein
MTTNATMLNDEIINFLAENNVGVTVSIDGPKESNDRFRVFAGGKGSYDVIAPKIKELIKTHRSRSIGARVTLTAQVVDVKGIYRHLTEEMGFDEVGFAPVTTSPVRLYAIGNQGLDDVLSQFTQLAAEYLECALRNEHHGFSNVSDTLQELHHGVSKAYPCGAGLGLLGVSPSGDIGLCHRFVDSEAGKIGHLETGVDADAPAGVTTKRMSVMGTHLTLIFTTAIGFEVGPTCVSGSTAKLRHETRNTWTASMKGRHYEAP